MRDLRGLLAAWRQRKGETSVLVTVVNVEGSAYRRPGARMLVHADGATTGAVSGGCLEADIRLRARSVLETGQAVTIRYDTTPDDDIMFGVGGGCRGIVTVLLEPVMPDPENGLLQILAQCEMARKSVALATVIQVFREEGVRPGARLLQVAGEIATGNVHSNELLEFLKQALQTSQTASVPRMLEWRSGERSASVLLEVIAPPVPLIIFGGGQDAGPVADFARRLGWHVTVYDHRAAHLTYERFPNADERVCGPPEECATRLALGEDTMALVMTHSYHHDRELLKRLLGRPLRYLAMLGPRSRTRQLVQEIQGEIAVPDARVQALRTPAGLDIGAESPEEIALSIVAEMQAMLAGRCGGMLADRPGPIHIPRNSEEERNIPPMRDET